MSTICAMKVRIGDTLGLGFGHIANIMSIPDLYYFEGSVWLEIATNFCFCYRFCARLMHFTQSNASRLLHAVNVFIPSCLNLHLLYWSDVFWRWYSLPKALTFWPFVRNFCTSLIQPRTFWYSAGHLQINSVFNMLFTIHILPYFCAVLVATQRVRVEWFAAVAKCVLSP